MESHGRITAAVTGDHSQYPAAQGGSDLHKESRISEANLPAGHSHNLQVATTLALLSSLKVTHKCSEVQEKQAVLFSYKETEHIKGISKMRAQRCYSLLAD